ncbi:MAG: hypothetical protein IPM24_21190 [Bryobacterales bacterium]|nr:hypothetical protein [Bryobacterales bacterium]
MRGLLPKVAYLCALALLAGCAPDRAAISDAVREDGGPLIVLADEQAGLEAAIAPDQGGELTSLRVRRQGEWIETLHRARDYSGQPGWRGKALFLWPATGRNFPAGFAIPAGGREGAWDFQGERYPMPIHGFAGHMPWTVESRRDGFVALSLRDTGETRRVYPFGFTLTAQYRIERGALSITYYVQAAADNQHAMPFSIGNHITFRTPLIEGGDPGALWIQTPSTVEYLKRPPGLPTGETRPRSLDRPVRLADLPAKESVSLGGYAGDPWLEYRDPRGMALRITQNTSGPAEGPVVRFNLWGDPSQGYYSPEPWVGMPNSLVSGKGLIKVEAGESWRWRIVIEPSRGR